MSVVVQTTGGTSALTVVNNVLSRLRENTVTSTTFDTNALAQLVLRFVNEAKREVEDAWDWTCLRQTVSVSTASGTSSYSIAGAGNRFRFYDPRRLIFNSTNKTFIYPYSQAQFEEAKWNYSVNNQIPNWYRILGVDLNNDPNLDLYPTPDGTYALKVPLVIPNADLSAYNHTFSVSGIVVELGAYYKAIVERGEDNGVPSGEAGQAYRFALGDAVSRDAGLVEDETIWSVV